MEILAVFFANSAISGLGAIDVMNMAEVMTVAWNSIAIRKAPIFLAVFPGSDPKVLESARTMG